MVGAGAQSAEKLACVGDACVDFLRGRGGDEVVDPLRHLVDDVTESWEFFLELATAEVFRRGRVHVGTPARNEVV